MQLSIPLVNEMKLSQSIKCTKIIAWYNAVFILGFFVVAGIRNFGGWMSKVYVITIATVVTAEIVS